MRLRGTSICFKTLELGARPPCGRVGSHQTSRGCVVVKDLTYWVIQIGREHILVEKQTWNAAREGYTSGLICAEHVELGPWQPSSLRSDIC